MFFSVFGQQDRHLQKVPIIGIFESTHLFTPLLVVSAVDNQLADKLVVQGHWVNTDDIAQIFKQSVDENKILSGTFEELQLFRYVLRLNSTRIVPNTSWPEENLPLEENSPLLVTTCLSSTLISQSAYKVL